ncbi:MAG: ATP-grasp domain-containing protein [Blastocatellia bacterium]|nr:ATP-grasp domain-containing protein [Blastocatellia bacterium]
MVTVIEKALIQEMDHFGLDPETGVLTAELTRRGLHVTRFREKALLRGRLHLHPTTFVAGSLPVIQSTLKQLGIPAPVPIDYPPVLKPWLHRRIWEDTLGEVRNRVYEAAHVDPFFIKPKGKLKRFEGRVVHGWNDLSDTYLVSRYCEVYCAEPVKWRSEYRVFVLHGEVLGIRLYEGNPAFQVNETTVWEAVRTFHATGESPAAYALDFGVLLSGETALVEMNDAFALGSYRLEPALYTDLLLARWAELVSLPPPSPSLKPEPVI